MSYIARISFNNIQWQDSSGRAGKSNSRTAFEGNYGFGFEEWIFCNRNQLKDENGIIYQYGYLQGLSKRRTDLDTNKRIDLWTLFFQRIIRPNPRYFIATINDWQEVSFEENENIINNHSNLIDSMRTDLNTILNEEDSQRAITEFERACNGNLHNGRRLQLFNIKFPVINAPLNFNTNNPPIPIGNPIYRIKNNGFYLYENINIIP